VGKGLNGNAQSSLVGSLYQRPDRWHRNDLTYVETNNESSMTEGLFAMQTLSPSTTPRQRVAWMLTLALLGSIPANSWAGPPTSGQQKKPGPTAAARKAAAKIVLPPRPDKRLTPDQVVKFQMEALQHNDVPKPDSGIATTFAFASPQNRLATGPLDHFTQIVKAPAYLPMLNCKKITYDPIMIEDESAQQRVHIIAADGSRIAYIFMLSRQKDGPYAGCWMNDGCVREDSDTESHRFDA